MAARIRVGVVGASPTGSWATRAHLPALASLDEYQVAAICTRTAPSAHEVARQYGIPRPLTDVQALLGDPDIDLVTICVRVPYHYALVRAALDAGKDVLCEWPLTVQTGEAQDLLERARRAGVVHAVGLQARFSPVVNHLRDLVGEGRVGDVLSWTAIHSAPHTTRSAYLQDEGSGGNLSSIATGHTLDMLQYVLGPVKELSATTAVSLRRVRVDDTGELVDRTAPDQIAVTASLQSGALGMLHLTAGPSEGTGFRLEIHGSRGDLVLLANDRPPSVQMTTLTLHDVVDGTSIETPAGYRVAPSKTPGGQPLNVAQLYVRLAECRRTGTQFSPDFGDAVVNHRLLDAVRRAASTGQRVVVS